LGWQKGGPELRPRRDVLLPAPFSCEKRGFAAGSSGFLEQDHHGLGIARTGRGRISASGRGSRQVFGGIPQAEIFRRPRFFLLPGGGATKPGHDGRSERPRLARKGPDFRPPDLAPAGLARAPARKAPPTRPEGGVGKPRTRCRPAETRSQILGNSRRGAMCWEARHRSKWRILAAKQQRCRPCDWRVPDKITYPARRGRRSLVHRPAAAAGRAGRDGPVAMA